MVGDEPIREPWDASFIVMAKHGRELVLIEAVEEWGAKTPLGMSADFIEAVLKSTIQGEVDVAWQKKASYNSQCVNRKTAAQPGPQL
jgi:hypothetical protein